MLENHYLKERIEALEAEVVLKDNTINGMQITIDNLKWEIKDLLQEIKDKEEDARDLAFERDLARDRY